MKKILMFLTLFVSVLAVENSYAVEGGSIVGLWYMPKDKEGLTPIAEIFETNGKYYAYAFAFTDLNATPKKDMNNPNKSLRDRSLRGLIFVYDLSFEDGKWVNGEIYSPDGGKYFYLKGKLSTDGKELTWKASIDKPGVFGENIMWKKVASADLAKYNSLKPERSVVESNIPKKRMKK